jgi:hypothetical protein
MVTPMLSESGGGVIVWACEGAWQVSMRVAQQSRTTQLSLQPPRRIATQRVDRECAATRRCTGGGPGLGDVRRFRRLFRAPALCVCRTVS